MNSTQQTVLNILIETLQGIPTDIDPQVDWSSVYEELRLQSLLPMTYPWLKKHGIPDAEITKKWTEKLASQSVRWFSMSTGQKELLQILSDHGYDVAILKGAANSAYFPVPQLRQSSDIDFLVRWNEYEEIYQLLLDNGYLLVGEKSDTKHHVELKKNRVIYEMHKRPGGTRIRGKYKNLDMVDFFQKGLDHVEIVTCGKNELPTLPKLQTAMVLLMHTAQHMKGGLGLRHILDWMMFAKVNADDHFWYSELKPIAKKGNVDTLAKVMTKMCQKYLGLTDKITWCKDADEKLCDQLMEYVLDQGDFGVKAGEKDQEVKLLAESQSAGGFLAKLADSSLYSMPASRKHKILRPFAWIYQLYRYLVKWFSRKNSIKTFSENSKKAKNRVRFFNNLGLKIDDK